MTTPSIQSTNAHASGIDWAAIKQLFESLIDLPAGERSARLANAEVSSAVRTEVQALLAHHANNTADNAFLRVPAAANFSDPRTAAGQRFGTWEIVQRLGVGGMGEVFEARRADGSFEGRAAIKLLRRGMNSAVVLQRFSLERQALARLNHPHIATLLDAGLSDQNQPYFVMELVSGVPITDAVRGQPLEARLALFLQLADAVAHAHRKLLVHRDLKPSNVLVTAESQVKLLDFGIAKALGPDDGEDAWLAGEQNNITADSPRPFTLNYASPEQVRGEPVSTATDIYSLGGLLYQMLTGQRPTGRGATNATDAARSVLEETPTRPSSLNDNTSEDPQWLQTRRRLQGDLDNILLKSLEKTAERRYASVDAMAQDVRSFLTGHAVSVRAPTARYLAGKFVARNKVSVAAAALALLATVGGFAATLWQAREARLARDDARQQLSQIKRITTDLVFRFGDTVTSLPGGAKAQEALLKQTVASLEPALMSAPTDPDLMALMASALGRLAELQGNTAMAAPERNAEAETTVARALQLGEAAWPAKRDDWRFVNWLARTWVVKAQLARGKGQLQDATDALQTMVARTQAALALQPSEEGQAYLLAGIANAHIMSAQVHAHHRLPSRNQPAEALKQYALAEATLRDLLARKTLLDMMDRDAVEGDVKTEVYLTHQLAAALGGRAQIHQMNEDLPAMRTQAAAAVALHQSNVAREPKNLAWRNGLMTESNTLAIALLRLGAAPAASDASNAPAALQASTLSWQAAEVLARDGGANNQWLGSQASLSAQHGRALAGVARHEEAIKVYALGLQSWADKLKANTADANAVRRVAWFQIQRARSEQALGRTAQATTLIATANASLRTLTQDKTVGREANLSLAEGLSALVQWRAAADADTATWKREGLSALDAAAAMKPLGTDQIALRESLR